MKVLILVALVAVATAKPAENSIQRLVRSLAEDKIMKRDIISVVVNANCVCAINSVIGLPYGGCDFLSFSVASKCKQCFGSHPSALFTPPFTSICSNLAKLALNECNKGTVQNLADSVCPKFASSMIG
ncbi:uncharacterized protein LOC106173593 [Lingula anatina]|uniref:Uncharacterized protein LOC106173593 n=1 Tax=Lingula anatina TaxID=7574 RepID=A0A1S3JIH8_LINAN|nr:uncharacterized protein LOC106173593 [Lingula anatina]|eukprot:XP_013410215.1 uncharacterized protein LOC106173593 [Lingula anatina]